jgi:hypothetical protein
VTYPGTIALSTAHLTYMVGLLRAHRTAIGTRWTRVCGRGAPASPRHGVGGGRRPGTFGAGGLVRAARFGSVVGAGSSIGLLRSVAGAACSRWAGLTKLENRCSRARGRTQSTLRLHGHRSRHR